MNLYYKIKSSKYFITKLGEFYCRANNDNYKIVNALYQWILKTINSNIIISKFIKWENSNKGPYPVVVYQFSVKTEFMNCITYLFFKQLDQYCNKQFCFQQFLNTLSVRLFEIFLMDGDHKFNNNIKIDLYDDCYCAIYCFGAIDFCNITHYLDITIHNEQEVYNLDKELITEALLSLTKNEIITIMKCPLDTIIRRATDITSIQIVPIDDSIKFNEKWRDLQ